MTFTYTMLLVMAITIPAMAACLVFNQAVKKIITRIKRNK